MDKQSFIIGVDRLFLAELTSDTSSGVTYGTPFAVPGVTEIATTLNNSLKTIYADNGAYENVAQQGDIDVAVSLAGLDGETRADVTGVSYDSSTGVVTDSGAGTPKKYALLYRKQKVTGAYRFYTYFAGSFSKPDETTSTLSGSVNEQAMQYTYRALNRTYDSKLSRSLDTDNSDIPTGLTATLLNSADTGWFSDPDYAPVAPGTAISDLAASTGTSSGQIVLTFSAPTGATSVTAQVQDINGWLDVSTIATITAASTTATITGLTAGNTYNCRLIVIGGDSNGISNDESAAAYAAG